MKAYVLDASVVLTFLLGKSSSVERNFIEILKKAKNSEVKLYSSYLLPCEVGNGLRYSLSDKALAERVLQKFLNLPLEFFAFSPAHYSKILQLSYFFETSFYDTSYHFLANLLKGVFLTCDAEYFKKAKKLGNIELL